VAYKIKPFSLPEDKQVSLAKKLAEKGKIITQSQVGHVVQEVMSAYTMDELFAPGGRTRFERDVQRNAKAKLGEFGIEVQSVMVVTLEMPANVKASLEEAHERAVQTESEAKALSRLHQVISQFTDKDMERLAELERLRMLGKNGVSMVMPMTYSLNSTPHPQTSPRITPPPSPTSVSLLTPEAIQANFAIN
jgi:regulator of protease activity HflC (stomatin/prohibitin superfamily)